MHDKYLGLTPEEFGALFKRNMIFQGAFNDVDKEPIKVFSPMPAERVAGLHMIREVSKDLERKKQEDMKKAAQKAEESEEKPEEKTEEKTEDNAEEKKPETEK